MPIQLPSPVAFCKLWVDGEGCYLLCFDDGVSIGNSRPQRNGLQQIGIVADLGSNHCRINYAAGSYWLTPLRKTALDGEAIQEPKRLTNGSEISLGDDVRLRFSVPSSLSQSAAMYLESGHRFDGGIDQVILFRRTCVLGTGQQKHINCRGWLGDVVLFTRENILFCKTMRGEITINAQRYGREVQVVAETHLQGEEWSMRIEAIPPKGADKLEII